MVYRPVCVYLRLILIKLTIKQLLNSHFILNLKEGFFGLVQEILYVQNRDLVHVYYK